MSKFKIGDKVIPVKIDDRFHPGLYEGETYLVDNVKAPGLIDIVGNFRGFAPYPACGSKWPEEWFELADEQLIEKGNKEMTAEQIRNEILRIDVRIEEAKKDIENAETERSVLVEKLREKGFSLTMNPQPIVRYSKGDKLIVVGNTTLHRFPNGTVVTVIEDSGNYYDCKDRGGMVWSCHDADVVKFK